MNTNTNTNTNTNKEKNMMGFAKYAAFVSFFTVLAGGKADVAGDIKPKATLVNPSVLNVSTTTSQPFTVVAAQDNRCKEAASFLNYDAEKVQGVQGVQEGSWTNEGMGGPTWDANLNLSGGLIYQEAGNCSHSDGPCLVSDASGSNTIYMASSVAKTWGHQLHCFVGYVPGTTISRAVQTSSDISSRNVFGSNGPNDFRYVAQSDGIDALESERESLLVAACMDATDPTSASFAVNGEPSSVDVNVSGSAFRDIERISLGGRFNAPVQGCADCEIHQYIAWDTDPGLSATEMSACLFNKWGRFSEPEPLVHSPSYFATTDWPLSISTRQTSYEADFEGARYDNLTPMPSATGGVLNERVMLFPNVAGTFPLGWTITPPMRTAAFADVDVHVVDPAATPPFTALLVGDSLTFAQTYPTQTQDRIFPNGTLLGTQGLASAPHEGRGGWHWQRYSIAGSPFYNNSGLDIPNYLSTLGATPDVVVWALFTNRVRSATDAEYQAVEDSEFAFAEAMLTAWPQSNHAIVLPLPGNAKDNAWSTPSRETWRQRNQAIKQRILTQFGGRESEGIYVVPAETSVAMDTAYNDNVHPDNDYEGMGDSIANFLHWWAQNQCN